jgi:hypothetical protein
VKRSLGRAAPLRAPENPTDAKSQTLETTGAAAPVLVPMAVPRISLTPDDAAIAAGVSRTRIFEAIRKGKLVARGDGKATIIEVSELARWVCSLPTKRAHVVDASPQSATV